jgi:hypothetical protein
MAKKLIQTNFRYSYTDPCGPVREQFGSYLGRTAASRATLLRFLRGNFKRCGLEARVSSLTIGSSHESQWIAK